MTETQYDWSRFDVHMPVAAEPAALYDWWATGQGMERFFAKRFRFTSSGGEARAPGARAEAGDSYWLAFHHPFELRGDVLEAVPGDRFAFTFGPMRVDVAFEPAERGALIRLTQSAIPIDAAGMAESHMNCRSCWIYYLLNLRSALEHGCDLRDDGLPDSPVSIHFGERMAEISR